MSVISGILRLVLILRFPSYMIACRVWGILPKLKSDDGLTIIWTTWSDVLRINAAMKVSKCELYQSNMLSGLRECWISKNAQCFVFIFVFFLYLHLTNFCCALQHQLETMTNHGDILALPQKALVWHQSVDLYTELSWGLPVRSDTSRKHNQTILNDW